MTLSSDDGASGWRYGKRASGAWQAVHGELQRTRDCSADLAFFGALRRSPALLGALMSPGGGRGAGGAGISALKIDLSALN